MWEDFTRNSEHKSFNHLALGSTETIWGFLRKLSRNFAKKWSGSSGLCTGLAEMAVAPRAKHNLFPTTDPEVAGRCSVRLACSRRSPLTDAAQMRRLHKTYHKTENATSQVEDKWDIWSTGFLPGFAAPYGNILPRRDQCHGHDGYNDEKLNKEEHQDNADDNFHAHLSTDRHPQ